MKKAISTKPPVLTVAQRADLAAAPDLGGDTADIPEAPAANWAHASGFFKLRKESISLRLDAEILD